MKPSKPENGAVVDLVDAILRDGVVLQADVIISVADIPLVGLKLRAALAGMDTMTEYGIFEEWDAAHRRRALDDDTTRETSFTESKPASIDGEHPDSGHSDDEHPDDERTNTEADE